MTQKFALIIGNSDYQDSALARLAMPVADVNGLADVLQDPQIGGFDQVSPLVNRSAADVRLEIESFFADKKPDDLLLLYFTGHGVRDDQGQLYLAVNDTKHSRLRATAIPASYVTGEMDRSRSRRQVLILDCCHSGSFAQGAKGITGESVGTKSAFEGIGYGRVVLTATDATQYAWEGDQVIGDAQNSVFTLYLLQGLRSGEADTNGDGKITLDELYDYVYEHVVTATPKQTPGKWSYKQQGEIVIANNPRPVIQKVELPVELNQAIESPFSSVREGVVRELERLLRSKNQGLALAAQEALKQLADDDSRRVAAAAADVLQAYSERTLRQVTPAQSEAIQKDAVAHKPSGAELRRATQMEQPRLQGERADANQRAPEPLTKLRTPTLATAKNALMGNISALLGARGSAMLILLVGWVFAALVTEWLFGGMNYSVQTVLSAHLVWSGLDGLSTALALRSIEPRVQGRHMAVIVAGWLLVGLLTGLAFSWLHEHYVNEYLQNYADFFTTLINVSLGGFVTLTVLRQIEPRLRLQQLALMMMGVCLGAAVMGVGITQAAHSFILGIILFMFGVLVGASVLFWQFERPLTEGITQAEADSRARAPADAERAARQKAEQARLAKERAHVEQAARQTVGAENAEVAPATRVASAAQTLWLSVALTAIGWGLAYLVYVIISTTGLISYYGTDTELDLNGILYWMSDSEAFHSPVTHIEKWAMIGVMVGGAIGLILKRRDSAMQRTQILLVAIGWGAAYTIGIGFGGVIITSLSERTFDSIAWVIVNIVTGVLGGLITGLVLRLKEPALQRKQLLIVVLGWGMAYALGWVVVSGILAGRSHKVMEAFLLFGGIAGLAVGAIGGGVMFWQLNHLHRKT